MADLASPGGVGSREETSQSWRWLELGEVADFVNGYAFNNTHWGDSGRPIIRIQNLTGTSSKFNYFDGEVDYRYSVDPGDLLISWSASLDAFIWSGPKAWLNQHIFRVTISGRILTRIICTSPSASTSNKFEHKHVGQP